MVYAIVEAGFVYGDTTNRYTFPLSLGQFPPKKARNLTPASPEVSDALIGAPFPEGAEIVGFVALKPERERRGKRFGDKGGRKRAKKAGRGSRSRSVRRDG